MFATLNPWILIRPLKKMNFKGPQHYPSNWRKPEVYEDRTKGLHLLDGKVEELFACPCCHRVRGFRCVGFRQKGFRVWQEGFRV